MVKTITIKGKKYPIDFCNEAFRNWEREFDQNFYARVMSGFGQGATLEVSYHAVKVGHERKEKPFDMSFNEFMKLVDSDMNCSFDLLELLTEALPKGDSEETEDAKKKTPAAKK